MTTEQYNRVVFGTDEASPAAIEVSVGDWRCLVQDGALREIRWNSVELIRGIDCPVRDVNWGTSAQQHVVEQWTEVAGQKQYRRTFGIGDGAVVGELVVAIDAAGAFTADLTLTATADFSTNRAGFVVLHPIDGVAGSPLRVTHPDGTTEPTAFPQTIAPSQPVMEIAGLSHAVSGVSVSIEFVGEVFEMEDQRNWADASYKTYCRPLGWGFPYTLAAGQRVRQTIRVTASDADAPDDLGARVTGGSAGATARRGGGFVDATARVTGGSVGATWRKGISPADWTSADADSCEPSRPTVQVPELLLAVERDWVGDETPVDAIPAGVGWLVRLDRAASGQDVAMIGLTGRHGGPVDLELVVPQGVDVDAHLASIADWCVQMRVSPRHVIALPEAYLKSHQPSGPWPAGISPTDATTAARKAFGQSRIGVGMLTNFTELNRCRPDPGIGDYVSHGICAIVHAADDRSVLQTLETIGQILASTRAIAIGRPIRLGLVSIAMRSNPYGSSVATNPGRIRKPMAIDDPRQRGLFAAAYAVGAIAAAAKAGVQSLAIASPAGPFAMQDASSLRPIGHVLRAIAPLAGLAALPLPGLPAGVHAIGARDSKGRVYAVLANASLIPQDIRLPETMHCRFLTAANATAAATDHQWVTHSPAVETNTLRLGGMEIAFAEARPSA